MLFSDEAWQVSKEIYNKIITHPFITELANGTLAQEKFVYYIGQDALYLGEYSRGMALAAVKTNNADKRLFFLETAKDALCTEIELHKYYKELYNIPQVREMTPTNFAYSNYFQAVGMSSTVGVLAAALLPCAWVYAEVGLHLQKIMKKENNPYEKWITTYADPAFMDLAKRFKGICNDFADISTTEEKEEMFKAYIMATRLEYCFWNDAYNLTQWAV